MEIHEFVCADCEVDVFSWGGPTEQTRCSSCETIREMEATMRMSPEMKAKLREMLGCVIPVREGAPPEEP